ncbi:hypothetical protein [Bradyrhizobium liaoningense]
MPKTIYAQKQGHWQNDVFPNLFDASSASFQGTCPDLMDRFISFIHENWCVLQLTQLAAYDLWRMLWIYPFIEGNGTCYLLCARIGRLLPGKLSQSAYEKTVRPYIAAPRAADVSWNAGNYDIIDFGVLSGSPLRDQLREAAAGEAAAKGNEHDEASR